MTTPSTPPTGSGINWGWIVTGLVATLTPIIATKLGVDNASVATVLGGVAALASHLIEQLLTQPSKKGS